MDLQETKMSCGNAVIREVLKRVDKKHFKKYVPLSCNCKDFLGMKNELLKNGANAVAYKDYEIPEKLAKDQYLILQTKSNGCFHFLLLLKLKKKKALIFDPAYGQFYMSREELTSIYTKNALIVEKGEGASVTIKQPCIIKTKTKVFLAFLSLIRGVSALFFFLLISNTNAAGRSILFLLPFTLSLSISVIFMNYLNKRYMEKKVLPYLQEGKVDQYEDAVLLFSDSLRKVERFYDQIVFLLVALVLVLSQNAIFIWLFVLNCLLFITIDKLTLHSLEQYKAKCAYQESAFLYKVNLDYKKAISLYELSHKSSIKYAFILMSAKLVSLLLLGVALVGFMYSQKINGISYFISSFSIFAATGFNVSSLLREKEEEKIRQTMYRLGNSFVATL